MLNDIEGMPAPDWFWSELLLDDWEKSATIGFKGQGDPIWLIGADPEFAPEIGQTLWLREIHGRSEGVPPTVDLTHERNIGELIRMLIAKGVVNAVHDVSDGGMLVALTEMALAGNVGAELYNTEDFGNWIATGRATCQHAYLSGPTAPGDYVAILQHGATLAPGATVNFRVGYRLL